MKKNIVNDYKSGINVKILAVKYHTSSKKVKSILLENGIDIHDPNRNFGPRHKMPDGYWKIKENNERAASECRNRREFSKKHVNAYKFAKETGWINEYDEKYFSKEKKYASFDEKIHIVYAYEIPSLNHVYVGRTMDIKRRHCSHKSSSENDCLYKFCSSNNINVPEPKILISGLTAVESQYYEDKFKNEYENNGWITLNKAKTGINTGSLGARPRIWNYDTCRDAAEHCKNREEFKKSFSRAHIVSRKNGWIDDFFPQKDRVEVGYFNVLENCIKEAVKYNSIMDIRKNYPFLYQRISKNKWTEQVREAINKKTQE